MPSLPTKEVELDWVTHEKTLPGVTEKRVYGECPQVQGTGASAGDGKKRSSQLQESRGGGGLVKADFFTLSRTLTISRKPSRRQERAGIAERVPDSVFKRPTFNPGCAFTGLHDHRQINPPLQVLGKKTGAGGVGR